MWGVFQGRIACVRGRVVPPLPPSCAAPPPISWPLTRIPSFPWAAYSITKLMSICQSQSQPHQNTQPSLPYTYLPTINNLPPFLPSLPTHPIGYNNRMSRKLKFKIISCSSEQQQQPVSSLLFSNSTGWQTRRFCTYPQQITLEFYGVVNVRRIQLVSDHRKISSQVDILYYLPVGGQGERFYKYGYLQFNRNETSHAREQKTIMVDLNCLYLRFLFHKPHPTKENFFSQVGLHSLGLFGSDDPELLPAPQQPLQEEEANEDDELYIAQRMAKLTAEKEAAIAEEDFENANYYKHTIGVIQQVAAKLRENRARIRKAVEMEDYDTANEIKKQIDKNKQEINQILEEGQQERQGEPELQGNEFAEEREERQEGNEFMEAPLAQSRQQLAHSRQTALALSRPKPLPTQPQENYDERVIPALRNNRTKTDPDDPDNEKPKPPPPVQQIQGKFIKQATAMQQYFDEQTTKKFFSAHWQHNADGLTTMLGEARKKHREAGLVRCLVAAVKLTGKQTNIQVSQLSLALLQELLKINAEAQLIAKPGDLQNDLQDVGRQVVRKLTDNNPKIKAAAESAFAQMVASSLYGVEGCSAALCKSKVKLSSKQLTTRLAFLSKMIEQHGLSGSQAVPLTALDFAVDQLRNPAEEVRRVAVALLATAHRKDKPRTQSRLTGVKDSILEQIVEGGSPAKPKKK